MEKANRFYEIDLLRFISACMVVIFHYTFVGHGLGKTPSMEFVELSNYTKYLYLGINTFFIISGFVIFMTVVDGKAREFLVSRVVRLYPAYWFAVLFTGTCLYFFAENEKLQINVNQWMMNFTMFQSAASMKHIESAYWTLWIELKFYLVILFLALMGWLRLIKPLIFISLTSSILFLFFGKMYFHPFNSAFPNWWGYFATGIIFYLIKRDGIDKGLALLLSLAVFFIATQNYYFCLKMQRWYGVDFSYNTLLAINALVLLFFALMVFKPTNILRHPAFIFWGALTYPLYLIHQDVGYVIFNAFSDKASPSVLFISTFILMLLLAFLINRFIEKPGAKRLKKLLEIRFSPTKKNNLSTSA